MVLRLSWFSKCALGFVRCVCCLVGTSFAGVIYVDHDATGSNNGSSWGNAFTSIAPALMAATSSDEIWVAEGTYAEGNLLLKSNVGLYGGFQGTETEREQRDWEDHVTTIDGSGYYHVLVMVVRSNVVVDGFTITGGDANGSATAEKRGGGIYCYSVDSASKIQHNLFKGNHAGWEGGAIWCQAASPLISDNRFLNNYAWKYGGAIVCTGSSNPQISNNIFSQNSVSDIGSAGLAIFCDASSPQIINNLITANASTHGSGAGIYCGNSSSPEIRCNIICGNYGYTGAGIYLNGSSSPLIQNNLFAGNSANTEGGAIRCFSNCSPLIINNTFSGNRAGAGGGVIRCTSNCSPLIKNNIFADNQGCDICEADADSDPQVKFNDFWGNPEGCYYDEGSTGYTQVSTMDSNVAECSQNMGEEPLFVGDLLSGGTWTADSIYDSTTYQTRYTDSSASWEVNELVDLILRPGTSVRQFYITSNTATVIMAWGYPGSVISSGESYQFHDYHLQSTAEGYPNHSPCIDVGDPADDYSHEPIPNGGRINLGCYGNTAEAARGSWPARATHARWLLYF